MWKKAWSKVKQWWTKLSPEVIKYANIVMDIIGPVLLSVAGQAVVAASKRDDLSGWDRFDFAVDVAQSKMPDAAAEAVINAVRIAYTDWSGKLSEK